MSKRYSMQDLTRIAQAGRENPSKQSFLAANDNERRESEPFDVPLAPILSGCGVANDLIENAANHTYDEWLALAQLLSRVEGGRQVFHEVSSKHPEYNEREADHKYDEARFNLKPPTCMRLAEVSSSTACQVCALNGTINSPYKLPTLPPESINMYAEYAAVVHPPMFVNVLTGKHLSDKSFQKKFSHLSEKGLIATKFIKNRSAGKVERLVYRPGETPGISPDGNNNVLNVWRDTGVVAKAGSCSALTEHFELLVPDKSQRDHLLNYLAHLVQKPGVKVKHVILIIGGQGIGKSAIGQLIARIVGKENAIVVGPSEAEDKYKARWGNRQVLIFEELMADNRLKFYNDVKPWITEEEHSVEEKYIQSYFASTPRGMFAFSNEHAPTRISADDRRFFVVRSPLQKQSADYYNRLFRAIGGEELAAFKYQLLTRDISSFEPDAPPPMTEAKQELISDTKAPIENRLEDLIAAREGIFQKALVSIDAVRSALREDYREKRPSTAAVTTALRSLGHNSLGGQVRLKDNSRPRLWVIRDHEKWASADAQQVREEMAR